MVFKGYFRTESFRQVSSLRTGSFSLSEVPISGLPLELVFVPHCGRVAMTMAIVMLRTLAMWCLPRAQNFPRTGSSLCRREEITVVVQTGKVSAEGKQRLQARALVTAERRLPPQPVSRGRCEQPPGDRWGGAAPPAEREFPSPYLVIKSERRFSFVFGKYAS